MIHTVNQALLENAERFPVFAILLFTEEQPEVSRALENKSYYAALDKISGPDVLVFATLLFPARRTYPEPPPGVLPSLRPVWLEPEANEEIMGWFGIEDRNRLPVLAAFGFTGPTMHYQVYPIDDRSAGAVFASVRDRLQEIRKVLSKHDSAPGTESLFRALGWRESARNVVRGVRWFLRTISLIKGATGI